MGTVAFAPHRRSAPATSCRIEYTRAMLLRALIVAAADRLAGLIALQVAARRDLCCGGLMGGSEGVTRAAGTYFTIRIWSAPLALANYVVLGWLIGQARATLALGVQIAINLINMAATILLVLVLDAGIGGARDGRGHRRGQRASCSAS